MLIKNKSEMKIDIQNQSLMRISLVVFLLMLATGGMVATAHVATAQSVERSGDTIVVDELNQSTEVVQINIEDHGSNYPPVDLQDSNQAGFIVPNRTQVGDVSLINESVEVIQYDDYKNDSVIKKGTVRADLHAIAFTQQSPVWIDSDGNVRIPLDRQDSSGIVDGDVVNISGVEGDVIKDAHQISVAQDALTEDFERMDNVELKAYANSGVGPVSDTPIPIDPEIRDDGSSRILWHPLVTQGSNLNIQLKSGDNFTTSVENPGRVSLENGSDTELKVVKVTDRGGNVLLNRSDQGGVEFEGHQRVTATLSDGGEELLFYKGLADYPIEQSGFVINSGKEVSFGENQISSSVSITSNAQINENNSLLLESDSGLLKVQLIKRPSRVNNTTGSIGVILLSGLVFILPLGIGGALGWGTPKLIGSPSELLDFVINIIFVLALSLGAFWIISEFTAISLYSIYFPPKISQIFALFGLIFSGGLTLFVQGKISNKMKQSGSSSETVVTSSTFDAKVTVEGLDNYKNSVDIKFSSQEDPFDSSDFRPQRDLTQKHTGLDNAVHEVEAVAKEGNKIESSKDTVRKKSPEATIQIKVPINISIVDEKGDPIPNVVLDSNELPHQTSNTNGTIAGEIAPRSREIACTFSHPKYQSKSVSVSGGDDTFELIPKQGGIEVTTKIDQAPVSDIPLRIKPVSSSNMIPRSSDSMTSELNGNTITGKNIGEYNIESTIGDPNYRDDSTTVTVHDGRTEHCQLNIAFTWNLEPSHQDRINDIRDGIDELTQQRGQDTVIHEYYSTVIEEFLAAVESIPSSGALFVNSSVSPDKVADQLLTVIDRILDIFEESLSTKQNVDLFAACSDMPHQNVRWNGNIEIQEVISRLETSSQDSRGEAQKRYQEVEDGAIDQYKKELTEIEPVSEVHDRSLHLINSTSNDNELTISAYGTLMILESVEQAFEHQAIRERLSSTVF